MQKIVKPLSNSELIEDIRERIAEVYRIDPVYTIDDIQIRNPKLQNNNIYSIKRRHAYPSAALPHLERVIILLYQILKKMCDSEMQCDCNPFNYIVFDNPDDYIFLDAAIKEILKEEKDE